MTTGDGFDYREDAQKPGTLLGKTIRIARDGSIPAGQGAGGWCRCQLLFQRHADLPSGIVRPDR
jgi:hypothetical protein